jgi:hypothetical protein
MPLFVICCQCQQHSHFSFTVIPSSISAMPFAVHLGILVIFLQNCPRLLSVFLNASSNLYNSTPYIILDSHNTSYFVFPNIRTYNLGLVAKHISVAAYVDGCLLSSCAVWPVRSLPRCCCLHYESDIYHPDNGGSKLLLVLSILH